MYKHNYNSGNGFLTSIWGPMLWSLLHIISLNYPVKPTKRQKDDYYDFVMSLRNVLPCGACRKNMTQNLKNVKFTKESSLKNRDSFSRWVYEFHNEVNRMLLKPNFQTFEEIRDTYEMFRARCGYTKSGIEKGEKGCITPVNNIKSKCILSIIPDRIPTNGSLFVDKECYPYHESDSDLSDENSS